MPFPNLLLNMKALLLLGCALERNVTRISKAWTKALCHLETAL